LHGALNIHRHVVERRLDRRDDVADAGKVEDMVDAAEQRRSGPTGAHIAPLECKIGVCRMGGQIGLTAADEVVEDSDLMPARQQQLDHVAADEAGATGHQRDRAGAHLAPIRFMVRTL
jgi:hypothetical protein